VDKSALANAAITLCRHNTVDLTCPEHYKSNMDRSIKQAYMTTAILNIKFTLFIKLPTVRI